LQGRQSQASNDGRFKRLKQTGPSGQQDCLTSPDTEKEHPEEDTKADNTDAKQSPDGQLKLDNSFLFSFTAGHGTVLVLLQHRGIPDTSLIHILSGALSPMELRPL